MKKLTSPKAVLLIMAGILSISGAMYQFNEMLHLESAFMSRLDNSEGARLAFNFANQSFYCNLFL